MVRKIQNRRHRDKRPHTTVKICGQKFHSLVDCGSQITAISSSSYNSLPLKSRPRLEPVTTPLTAANGTPIKAKGQVREMPIIVNDISVTITLIVIENLNKSVILGADTLKKGNFIIDATSNLQLKCKFPITSQESYSIAPHEEKLIRASVSSELANKLCVFVPNRLNLLSALTEVTEKGGLNLLIQNNSEQTLAIHRRELLGHGLEVNKDSLISDVSYSSVINEISQQQKKKDDKLNLPSSQIKLDHISPKARISITDLVNNYPDIFSLNPNDIGHCKVLPQRILLKDPSKVACIPPYRIAPQLQPIVHAYVDKLYNAQVIQKSTSPFCSPLLLVQKAGSTADQPLVERYRVVHDFRKLNNNSIRDAYPLHNIHDLIDKVASAKFWSVIDLSSGFWNQSLHKDSRPYTAFAVPGKGHFEYTRTAQGLANSPAAFQRLLDYVVQGLPGVYVYIDDVIIATDTLQSHVETLEMVFQRFRKYNLKCRPKKIQLVTDEINYLGYNITQQDGIRAGKAKTKVIEDFKSPSDVTEIRRFLGLCSFFRRTIPAFSSKAQPLTRLTRKDAVWKKGKLPLDAEKAFECLKKELIKRPCLQPPDFTRDFILTVDASTKGLGAILSQKDKQNTEHPVAFGSRALNSAEQKYAPFRLEYLALVWACKHFKPYLVGKRFVVRTDHKPLLSFNKEKGSVYDRYLLELSEYDFEMTYIQGPKMPADVLSRIYPTKEEITVAENTKEIQEITNLGQYLNISSSQLKELQKQDKFIKALAIFLKFKSLPKNDVLRSYVERESREACIGPNDIVQRKGQAFAPHGLKMNLIHLAHDMPMSGHYSYEKTLQKLDNWYWPEKKADVQIYCRSCPVCMGNNAAKLPIAKLGKLPDATDFNERVHIDLLGPLPNNSGYKYVMVMIDAYSKYLQVAPAMTKEMNEISQIFLNHWICIFGPCKQLVSDLGKEFKNQLFSLLGKQFNINQAFTTANHPQANGMAERAVQAVISYIRKYTDTNEWVHLLPSMMFAHNTTQRKPTGYTPYEAVFGRKCLVPSSFQTQKNYSSNPLIDVQNTLELIRKDLVSTQELYFKSMKDQYDKRARIKDIRPNDKVYVLRPHKGQQFQKFQSKFEGVFRVVKVTSNNNLHLEHVTTSKPKIIHVNNVKLLPFLHAFPEYSNNFPEDGQTTEKQKQHKHKMTPSSNLFLDDTPIITPAKTAIQRSQRSRLSSSFHSFSSGRNSPSSSSSSSGKNSPQQPSPVASPQMRSTRSRTGPLPEDILHTYPRERKSFATKFKNIFSPKK